MIELTTEAGRALRQALRDHAPWFLGGSSDAENAYIAAIEAEAIAAEHERAKFALDGLVCALCLFVGDSDDPRPITIINGQLTCEPHNGYFQGGDQTMAIVAWKREHKGAEEAS